MYIGILETLTVFGFFCAHMIIRGLVKRQRKIKSYESISIDKISKSLIILVCLRILSKEFSELLL